MKKVILFLILVALCFLSPALKAQQPGIPKPNMVFVEGGTFMMGSDTGPAEEKPVHKVTVDNFSIGKYEVTFAEFRQFVKATGYVSEAEKEDTATNREGKVRKGISGVNWKNAGNNKPRAAQDSVHPVTCISWNDAVAYCNWLSQVTGQPFRLPTEAEWEFASRGGTKSKGFKYSGSNNPEEVAWFMGNTRTEQERTVGLKKANELGIYDMSGNVREWCSDWGNVSYYSDSPELNPKGPDNGKRRVMRGGSWSSDNQSLKATYRNAGFPINTTVDLGFRVVRSETPTPKVIAKQEGGTESSMKNELYTKGYFNAYGFFFDTGSAKLKPESTPIINELSSTLQSDPALKIMLEGHTDNTGSDDANMVLSNKRAESIKAALVAKGIGSDRIQTTGFGSSQPIADNKTTDGRKQNRRVTIRKVQ